jgi:hypothetical protein
LRGRAHGPRWLWRRWHDGQDGQDGQDGVAETLVRHFEGSTARARRRARPRQLAETAMTACRVAFGCDNSQPARSAESRARATGHASVSLQRSHASRRPRQGLDGFSRKIMRRSLHDKLSAAAEPCEENASGDVCWPPELCACAGGLGCCWRRGSTAACLPRAEARRGAWSVERGAVLATAARRVGAQWQAMR